jgi:hypothetical protein
MLIAEESKQDSEKWAKVSSPTLSAKEGEHLNLNSSFWLLTLVKSRYMGALANTRG